MLGTRLFIGLSMVAGLLLTLSVDDSLGAWFPSYFPCWFLLSGLLLMTAALELVRLLAATGLRPYCNCVVAGILVILVSNWVPHVAIPNGHSDRIPALDYDPAGPMAVLAWPFLGFATVIMATFIVASARFTGPGDTMGRIAATILAVGYPGILGTFILQMRWFEGHLQGFLSLTFLVATAKGADVGAYTFGRLFGRHKLWPTLSPHNTIEGAVGGMVFALAAAFIVALIGHKYLLIPTPDWPHTIVYGLVVGAFAQLGDLMESMIKRDCARKDASDAIPGFGGVLDVVDSLLFAGPVAYALWLFSGP
jgi:phosphatidate cytidylyltransferase